jgi:hypothetical protein
MKKHVMEEHNDKAKQRDRERMERHREMQTPDERIQANKAARKRIENIQV